MKTSILKILFCILFLLFILGMFAIAELLAKAITMECFMTIVYIMLGISFIYFSKN